MRHRLPRSPFAAVGLALAALAFDAGAVLPAEPVPNVLTLDPDYPDSYVFAHDTNFFSLLDGKVVLLDVAATTRQYKGAIGAGQFASFIESTARPELYVAETFYPRRTRGERTDTITIYDKATLDIVDEIVLPGGKRGQMVTHKNTLQLTPDERYLLVYNFTPAESVTIVDIVRREVLNEIGIAGCSLVYITGKRGFSSLCSDGAMLTVRFDGDGNETSRKRLPRFFDIEQDPLFAKAVRIGSTAYFPSFHGYVQPIDFSGDTPVVRPRWSLMSLAEREANWRPGGWQIATGHPDGLLYVLMHEGGMNGSHKDGGSEVWVYDVETQKRLRRIALARWSVSIEVTRGRSPYLVVTNAEEFSVDVYDAASGELVRTIGGRLAETPFLFHAVK